MANPLALFPIQVNLLQDSPIFYINNVVNRVQSSHYNYKSLIVFIPVDVSFGCAYLVNSYDGFLFIQSDFRFLFDRAYALVDDRLFGFVNPDF